ncbi:MAG: hypothetical protein J6B13_01905 [Muribaculaceae bacterium]|nr:hypothetical protein [Muribaculaceae bacterium]
MKTGTRLLLAALLAGSTSAIMAHRPEPEAKPDITPKVASTPREGDSRVFLDHADVLYKQQNDSFMIVSGNVQFTKGPMVMKCDSAHFFPATESFDAFGHVFMEQGDTLFIYADELNYRAPERMAYLYADPGKKVRMINRDVTLETDEFTYDMGIEIGYYTTGGVLYDQQNRLVSREGEYIPSTKDANFYIDVNLTSLGKSDTLVIYSDSLFYNTATHIAKLNSPSEIINKRGVIYTTDGLYDTDLDTAALYMRSLVHSPEGRDLIADTIYYDRVSGIGECFGNMVMTDSARQAALNADYGFFNQATDSAYATGHLLIKEYSKGDTLYLHGGQLNAYRVLDSIHIPAVPADTVAGTPEIPASFRIDTTNVADIWPRVRFFRSDMQGVCDSMRATRSDTTLRMYRKPVVWSEQRQIFGNLIELHMNDSTIDRARLPEYGFTSQRIYGDYYDQLAGKEMVASFVNGELRQLDINGNVELIMYPEEADSTINKMVTAQSSFMKAIFAGQTTELIKMWPETSGTATPLFLVRRSMLYLPKFKLFNGIRPLSPSDIMVVPKAMDELMDGTDG